MGIINAKWGGGNIKQTSSYRLTNDTEKNTWNGKANASHSHTLESIKFNSSSNSATLANIFSVSLSSAKENWLNINTYTNANKTMYLKDGVVIDGIATFNDRTDFENFIHIYGTNGNYSECVRTHCAPSGWNSIVMCGDDNTSQAGTSAKTWGLFTYDGQFSIAKNGTNLNGNAATASLMCDVNNNWYANGSLMITVANLGNYTIQNSITAQMLYCNPPDQNTTAGCFMWQAANNTDRMPDGGWWSLLRCQHPGYPNGFWQELAFNFYNYDVRYRVNNNGTKNTWRKLVFDSAGITYKDPYDLEVERLRFYYNKNIDSSGDLHAANGGSALVINFNTTSMNIANICTITSQTTYSSQRSASANLYIGTDGVFYRATSASKYKLNIQNMDKPDTYCYDLLKLSPKQWVDRNSAETYSKYLSKKYNNEEIADGEENVALNCDLNLNYGLIAEDVEKAGLSDFCEYGIIKEDGTREIEGVQYDRLPILMIPILRDLVTCMNKILPYAKKGIDDEATLKEVEEIEKRFNSFNESDIINTKYDPETSKVIE